jgi:hypothetical protein
LRVVFKPLRVYGHNAPICCGEPADQEIGRTDYRCRTCKTRINPDDPEPYRPPTCCYRPMEQSSKGKFECWGCGRCLVTSAHTREDEGWSTLLLPLLKP